MLFMRWKRQFQQQFYQTGIQIRLHFCKFQKKIWFSQTDRVQHYFFQAICKENHHQNSQKSWDKIQAVSEERQICATHAPYDEKNHVPKEF